MGFEPRFLTIALRITNASRQPPLRVQPPSSRSQSQRQRQFFCFPFSLFPGWWLEIWGFLVCLYIGVHGNGGYCNLLDCDFKITYFISIVDDPCCFLPEFCAGCWLPGLMSWVNVLFAFTCCTCICCLSHCPVYSPSFFLVTVFCYWGRLVCVSLLACCGVLFPYSINISLLL